MEVWKNIEGYENYEVSSHGNVKRLPSIVHQSNGILVNYKGGILKLENVKGYKRVSLCKKNKVLRFQVHRLVALYFIDNPLTKKCVNHKNGIRNDNNINNLEWCTHSENEKHSYDVLGKINPIRKLTENEAAFIRSNYVMGINGNIKMLAEKYNVNVTTIYNVINVKYYV